MGVDHPTSGREHMKKATVTLAAMIAITGLCLAGSEANTIMGQFSCCSAGVGMFAGGLWVIAQAGR